MRAEMTSVFPTTAALCKAVWSPWEQNISQSVVITSEVLQHFKREVCVTAIVQRDLTFPITNKVKKYF